MKTILGSILLICSLLANAADTMTLNLDGVSPEFTVLLPANPTTGYQWTVTKYDKTFLQLTDSHYLPPVSKRMGTGGQMQFTFTRIKGKLYPHNTKMSFTYARSWEPKSKTVKQVTICFKGCTHNPPIQIELGR